MMSIIIYIEMDLLHDLINLYLTNINCEQMHGNIKTQSTYIGYIMMEIGMSERAQCGNAVWNVLKLNFTNSWYAVFMIVLILVQFIYICTILYIPT